MDYQHGWWRSEQFNPPCPKGSPMWFHWFIHIKFHFSLDQHSNVTAQKCLIPISLQLLNSHLECAAFIRNPIFSRCHNPPVLNRFLQHRCGATPKPKQCYASWEHAPLQLLLSKFAFQLFSRYWIMLHKCESVFMNPTVTEWKQSAFSSPRKIVCRHQ